MSKIRIGIIGTGGMGNAHANTYKTMKGIELTACMDVVPGRAEEFATRHGVKHAVTRYDDLLSDVDAVAVVTPDSTHALYTLAALKAGKHVICEKPLTVTLAEAKAVARAAAAASKRGQIHNVHFSYRKSSALWKAMEVVRSGALGELRHVHSHYLQSWLSCDAWENWTCDKFLWRLQTAAGSGGVLGDLGCHILDFTTAVAGDLASVRCGLTTFPKITPAGKRVTRFQGKNLDANDMALIEMRFANGAVGVCQATRWSTGHLNSLRLEVHGTEGALMIDLDKSYEELNLCLGKARHKPEWKTEKLKPAPQVIERFIRAIRTGKQEQPDILRGAEVQGYLDACERAGKSGGEEKVRSFGKSL